MPALLLDTVPDDLEVGTDDDGYVCSSLVADLDNDLFMTLECRLSRAFEIGEDTYEFSFSFVIADIEGFADPFITQNRVMVREYLNDMSVDAVMPTVCAAIRLLVNEVHPSQIYRVTKSLNMPAKAMAKHDLITFALNDLGYYEAGSGTDPFGRTFWLMSR